MLYIILVKTIVAIPEVGCCGNENNNKKINHMHWIYVTEKSLIFYINNAFPTTYKCYCKFYCYLKYWFNLLYTNIHMHIISYQKFTFINVRSAFICMYDYLVYTYVHMYINYKIFENDKKTHCK